MPSEEEFAGLEAVGGPGGRAGDAARPFAPEQLITCDECLRASAPTRMSCLYCGAPLRATEQSASLRRPTLKRLEEWERGFNVVTLPRAGAGLAPGTAEEAASLLKLDPVRLGEIVGSARALPLARASSAEEAQLVVQRLVALGLDAEIFPDETLAVQPTRVRALGLEEDALVCRVGPDAGPRLVGWSEVVLLVMGRIVSRRVEIAERKKGLGGRSEVVEAREFATDEAVLDICTTYEGEEAVYRVISGGFDYSCLGEGKGLLAAENFGALALELRRQAPAAIYDDEYTRLRPLLSDVWPPAERNESLGLRRGHAGRLNKEAVTTVSNEAQFTRYARLRHLLALRSRAERL